MWNNNTDVWKRWASEVGIPSGLTDASNDDEWGEIKRKKKRWTKHWLKWIFAHQSKCQVLTDIYSITDGCWFCCRLTETRLFCVFARWGLFESPPIVWQPVLGVPCLLPKDSWGGLQDAHDHCHDKRIGKRMDVCMDGGFLRVGCINSIMYTWQWMFPFAIRSLPEL